MTSLASVRSTRRALPWCTDCQVSVHFVTGLLRTFTRYVPTRSNDAMTRAADPTRVSRRAEALSLACQRGRGEQCPASCSSRRCAAITSPHLGSILMLSCLALQGKPNLSRKSVHGGPGGLRRQPAMAVTAQRGEQGHPSKSSLHTLRHKVCWLLCWNLDTDSLESPAQHQWQGLCFSSLVQSGDSDAEMACRCCPAARSSTPAPIWATSMRWVRCVRCRAVDPSDGHHLVSRQKGTTQRFPMNAIALCQHLGSCGCRTRLWTSCRWAGSTSKRTCQSGLGSSSPW